MKLCVLTSSYEQSSSQFSEYDTDPFFLDPHLQDHQWEMHEIHKNTAVAQVEDMASRGFDLFINLCDGAADEDRAGIEVVHTLERLDVPFTGANSDFYDPSRLYMKEACGRAHIQTPRFKLAFKEEDVCWAANNLAYPMIVKHWNSYGSIGTSRDSRVETAEELYTQAMKMIDTYKGALIEEFIEGREFNVLVVENAENPSAPYVYPPLEILFPENETFDHFAMKWSDSTIGVEFGPPVEPELGRYLQDVCGDFFTSLQGTGYGRCDLRLNDKNEAYVLEINPNCSIFGPLEYPGPYSCDYIILNESSGFQGFMDRIFRAAHRRVQL
ncbi:MAG: ATP-grasp domain-containing protein [Spirochaetes bacterium]|nr:ATP-grasp domain-containing protein [Spirochaetota bacterium]